MKEKYIPGEGYQCSARCSCECGCDADWTPREVYELREQRDRLAEALKDFEYERDEERVEVEKLKREVINWKTAHDIAIEQRDRAQDAIEMMLRDSSCRRIPAYTKEQLTAVEGGEA
jgi:hypothetical protein